MPEVVAKFVPLHEKEQGIATQMRTRDILVLSVTSCCDTTQFPVGYVCNVKIIGLGQ